jgi:hypothetical protein
VSYLAFYLFSTLFFTIPPFSSIQLLLLAIMDDDRDGSESWNKEQNDEKEDLSGLLVIARSVFR